ncbi:MAG: hypothetical protein R6V46_00740 [Desulfatiglandaceae bacterium]
MITPYDFLTDVDRFKDRFDIKTKLATIDPDYLSGDPKVQFDGESAITSKTYKVLGGYTPPRNHEHALRFLIDLKRPTTPEQKLSLREKYS